MPVQPFPMFPTFADWKRESAVGGPLSKPYRREDPALVSIDHMVKSLNRALSDGDRCYRLAGLFFTTMWWNNNNRRDPRMANDRRPAIMRLNLTAGRDLRGALNCGDGMQLATRLKEIYGRDMDPEKAIEDASPAVQARYMDAGKREAYRVIFKGGLAYHFKWDPSHLPTMDLQLLDTASLGDSGTDDNLRSGVIFVMSLSHNLYAGVSGDDSVEGGAFANSAKVKFHSCFMGGAAVLCGGTLCAERGVITQIRNDSGHYKPVDESMVATLRHLKSIGVDLRKITVIRETQLKQTHAGYVSRELAGDDRYQSEKRILGATAISTVKLQRAVESRGGAKALAAATCRADIFLGHHGNWNTIEAINPAARA